MGVNPKLKTSHSDRIKRGLAYAKKAGASGFTVIVLPISAEIKITPARPNINGQARFTLTYSETFEAAVDIEATLRVFRETMDKTGLEYSAEQTGPNTGTIVMTAAREVVGSFLVSEFLGWSKPGLMEIMLKQAGLLQTDGVIVERYAGPAVSATPA